MTLGLQLIAPNELQAQGSIFGVIHEQLDSLSENTSALSDVRVIMQPEAPRTASLTAWTDSLGVFSFELVEYGGYILFADALGYAPYLDTIYVGGGLKDIGQINLAPWTESLPELHVVDEEIYIIERGDTTRFRLEALMKGDEQNLLDVIERLPGLSLDGGRLTFNGERVDYLLLDGKDVQQFHHRDLFSRLESEKIEGIEVIEDFSELPTMDTVIGTDAVAVNVKMKEAYRGKWDISAKAGGGSDDVHLLSVDALRNGEKGLIQLHAASWANHRRRNQSELDIAGLVNSIELHNLFMEDMYICYPGAELSSIDQEVTMPDAQRIKHRTAGIKWTYRPDNKTIHKLRLDYGHDQLTSRTSAVDFYFSSNDIQTSLNRDDLIEDKMAFNYNLKRVLSKHATLKLVLPMEVGRAKTTTDASGTLNGTDFTFPSVNDVLSYDISPLILFELVGKDGRLSSDYFIAWNRSGRDRELTGLTDRVFTPFTKETTDPDRFTINIAQDATQQNLKYGWGAILKEKKWRFTSKAVAHHLMNRLEYDQTESQIDGLDGHQSLRQALAKHYSEVMHDFGKVSVVAELMTSYTHQRWHGESDGDVRWQPGGLLVYEWNSKWGTSVMYRPKVELIRIEQLQTLSRYQSPFSLATGGLVADQVLEQDNFSWNLWHKKTGGRGMTRMNLSINYTPDIDGWTAQTIGEDTITVSQFVPSETENSWSGQLQAGKSSKDFSFRLKLHAHSAQRTLFFDTSHEAFDEWGYQLNTSATYNKIKRVTATVSHDLRYYERNSLGRNFSSLLGTLNGLITIRPKKWRIEINPRLRHSRRGAQSSDSRFNLSFYAERQNVWKNLTAFVQAEQIFQGGDDALSIINVDANRIRVTTTVQQGVRVLFGVGWEL